MHNRAWTHRLKVVPPDPADVRNDPSGAESQKRAEDAYSPFVFKAAPSIILDRMEVSGRNKDPRSPLPSVARGRTQVGVS